MPEVWSNGNIDVVEVSIFDPKTAPLPEPAPRWMRMPLIRHLRAAWTRFNVERHYRMWGKMGFLPLYREYDDRCIVAIWRGIL